ncbi:hypothetical protein [Capnocytophaga sp.]|uniref:hypothetical protein n=1 Tax=Capnocytophaga sp. TaxID=44737 RepID=UPI0026DA9611|nr:hypothetical protein [Capnocytophaga sp.]MDO5104315.1 hypothetical protein [Capnocytophaga sp.]
MSQIEFIPLIEPPTDKTLDNPNPPHDTAPTEVWDAYQKALIDNNYRDFPNPIRTGIYQYRLFEVSLDNIERIIALHIGDMDIRESISLFGGYALAIDDEIVLFPQCCGLLEEIHAWKHILTDDFEPFYLPECHPVPFISKKGDDLVISCDDSDEDFIPPSTAKTIIINHKKAQEALQKLLCDLQTYAEKLNRLSDKYQVENLADILIFGQDF